MAAILESSPQALDQVDDAGMSLLLWAVSIVDWLLEHGAEVDAWSAVQFGRHDYIRHRAAADPS